MRDNPRRPTPLEFAHERLADQMEDLISSYDTRRRIDVLIDDFLGAAPLESKRVLDVGCGLGFFSQRLVQLGANVTACDLGAQLVEATRRRAGCTAVVADALELEHTFGPDAFDIVVSSECIEHTPDPERAIHQMLRVVRPQGLVSLSTPNLVWQPLVRLASAIGLRAFHGYENFSGWPQLRRAVTAAGGVVREERGLHLIPFQFGLDSLSRSLDRLQPLRGLMINLCLLAQKTGDGSR